DAHKQDRGRNVYDYKDRVSLYRQRVAQGKTGRLTSGTLEMLYGNSPEYMEHGDMGNLTPRILRCINELNAQMGFVGTRAALRRVHHNAESHRFREFGALTGKDMVTKKDGEQYGDGFPLTVFQPESLSRVWSNGKSMAAAGYGDVCTIETLNEFKDYVAA